MRYRKREGIFGIFSGLNLKEKNKLSYQTGKIHLKRTLIRTYIMIMLSSFLSIPRLWLRFKTESRALPTSCSRSEGGSSSSTKGKKKNVKVLLLCHEELRHVLCFMLKQRFFQLITTLCGCFHSLASLVSWRRRNERDL